ncbi:hypothetical protein ADUPG1_013630 [Aduncisulcus paluster]|uniref:Inhibitor of growth protein N-terminal histone-binding domain-containing protein n=1 Tax=Aduncisulcus paluster TaxID=2918883 RepID=A0ABQ5K468_9EUKA|nr:hypothetical protein ADUPG1_013630 [Aduncisulcus paluster]
MSYNSLFKIDTSTLETTLGNMVDKIDDVQLTLTDKCEYYDTELDSHSTKIEDLSAKIDMLMEFMVETKAAQEEARKKEEKEKLEEQLAKQSARDTGRQELKPLPFDPFKLPLKDSTRLLRYVRKAIKDYLFERDIDEASEESDHEGSEKEKTVTSNATNACPELDSTIESAEQGSEEKSTDDKDKEDETAASEESDHEGSEKEKTVTSNATNACPELDSTIESAEQGSEEKSTDDKDKEDETAGDGKDTDDNEAKPKEENHFFDNILDKFDSDTKLKEREDREKRNLARKKLRDEKKKSGRIDEHSAVPNLTLPPPSTQMDDNPPLSPHLHMHLQGRVSSLESSFVLLQTQTQELWKAVEAVGVMMNDPDDLEMEEVEEDDIHDPNDPNNPSMSGDGTDRTGKSSKSGSRSNSSSNYGSSKSLQSQYSIHSLKSSSSNPHSSSLHQIPRVSSVRKRPIDEIRPSGSVGSIDEDGVTIAARISRVDTDPYSINHNLHTGTSPNSSMEGEGGSMEDGRVSPVVMMDSMGQKGTGRTGRTGRTMRGSRSRYITPVKSKEMIELSGEVRELQTKVDTVSYGVNSKFKTFEQQIGDIKAREELLKRYVEGIVSKQAIQNIVDDKAKESQKDVKFDRYGRKIDPQSQGVRMFRKNKKPKGSSSGKDRSGGGDSSSGSGGTQISGGYSFPFLIGTSCLACGRPFCGEDQIGVPNDSDSIHQSSCPQHDTASPFPTSMRISTTSIHSHQPLKPKHSARLAFTAALRAAKIVGAGLRTQHRDEFNHSRNRLTLEQQLVELENNIRIARSMGGVDMGTDMYGIAPSPPCNTTSWYKRGSGSTTTQHYPQSHLQLSGRREDGQEDDGGDPVMYDATVVSGTYDDKPKTPTIPSPSQRDTELYTRDNQRSFANIQHLNSSSAAAAATIASLSPTISHTTAAAVGSVIASQIHSQRQPNYGRSPSPYRLPSTSHRSSAAAAATIASLSPTISHTTAAAVGSVIASQIHSQRQPNYGRSPSPYRLPSTSHRSSVAIGSVQGVGVNGKVLKQMGTGQIPGMSPSGPSQSVHNPSRAGTHPPMSPLTPLSAAKAASMIASNIEDEEIDGFGYIKAKDTPQRRGTRSSLGVEDIAHGGSFDSARSQSALANPSSAVMTIDEMRTRSRGSVVEGRAGGKESSDLMRYGKRVHTSLSGAIQSSGERSLVASQESSHTKDEVRSPIKVSGRRTAGYSRRQTGSKKISVTLPHTSHSKRSPPLSLSTHPGDFSVNGEKGYEKEKEEKEEDDKIMDSSKKKRSNTPTLPPVK